MRMVFSEKKGTGTSAEAFRMRKGMRFCTALFIALCIGMLLPNSATGQSMPNAPLYGFRTDDVWGLVTAGGTEGSNHGIYFGSKLLKNRTDRLPVVYVSKDSHYSNLRLADLQNLEVCLIDTNSMGRMKPDALRKALDPNRPALFGGYLPYTKYRSLVDSSVYHFNSISISGHKFFGMDDPCGLFLTTKEVLAAQTAFKAAYLNGSMPMISCSRLGLNPLKFYWIINEVGVKGFTKQATDILENAQYHKKPLDAIGWKAWLGDCSNTVFFSGPRESILKK